MNIFTRPASTPIAFLMLAGALTPAAAYLSPATATVTAIPTRAAAPNYAVQARLASFANRITGDLVTGSTYPGAGGATIDAATSTVTIAWKGPVPQRVRRLIAHRPPGIKVHLVPAKYDRRELDRAAERLWQRVSALKTHGVDLRATAPDALARSLVVAAVPVAGMATRHMRSASVESVLAGFAGTKVVAENAAPVAADSRRANTAPWIGGGLTTLGGRPICSTGFTGMWRAQAVILTAAHCGAGTFKGGTGRTIGKVLAASSELDIAFLSTSGGIAPRVFDHGINSPRSQSRLVKRAGGAIASGLLVCTDGATSGGHCGIRVQRVGLTIVASGIRMTGLVEARQTGGNGIAAATGDSGGAVWSFYDSARRNIEARGTISAIDQTWDCRPPLVSSAAAVCGRLVYFAPLSTAQRNGFRLKVG